MVREMVPDLFLPTSNLRQFPKVALMPSGGAIADSPAQPNLVLPFGERELFSDLVYPAHIFAGAIAVSECGVDAQCRQNNAVDWAVRRHRGFVQRPEIFQEEVECFLRYSEPQASFV